MLKKYIGIFLLVIAGSISFAHARVQAGGVQNVGDNLEDMNLRLCGVCWSQAEPFRPLIAGCNALDGFHQDCIENYQSINLHDCPTCQGELNVQPDTLVSYNEGIDHQAIAADASQANDVAVIKQDCEICADEFPQAKMHAPCSAGNHYYCKNCITRHVLARHDVADNRLGEASNRLRLARSSLSRAMIMFRLNPQDEARRADAQRLAGLVQSIAEEIRVATRIGCPVCRDRIFENETWTLCDQCNKQLPELLLNDGVCVVCQPEPEEAEEAVQQEQVEEQADPMQQVDWTVCNQCNDITPEAVLHNGLCLGCQAEAHANQAAEDFFVDEPAENQSIVNLDFAPCNVCHQESASVLLNENGRCLTCQPAENLLDVRQGADPLVQVEWAVCNYCNQIAPRDLLDNGGRCFSCQAHEDVEPHGAHQWQAVHEDVMQTGQCGVCFDTFQRYELSSPCSDQRHLFCNICLAQHINARRNEAMQYIHAALDNLEILRLAQRQLMDYGRYNAARRIARQIEVINERVDRAGYLGCPACRGPFFAQSFWTRCNSCDEQYPTELMEYNYCALCRHAN